MMIITGLHGEEEEKLTIEVEKQFDRFGLNGIMMFLMESKIYLKERLESIPKDPENLDALCEYQRCRGMIEAIDDVDTLLYKIDKRKEKANGGTNQKSN